MKNMQQNFTWQTPNWLRMFCLTLLVFATGIGVKAQVVNTYSFAESSGTYTAISGTASTAAGDDGTQGGIPLGFSFSYNGSTYTNVAVCTNGTLSFSGTTNAWTNTLNPTPLANEIAPFWDDHNQTGGTIQYTTTGAVGSRVFTMQWANIHIGGGGSTGSPTGNFQVKLYETTNQVEFIYGTFAAFGSVTASIGIAGAAGNFISVTPGSPSTTSTVTANDAISSNTFLPSGKTYTFAPPPPCVTPNPGNTLANGISGSFDACVGATVNCSLQNTSGSGATYQWSNLNGNIAGATNATYSFVYSAYDEIKCDVTCTGTTVQSTEVIINPAPYYGCYCQPIMFASNPCSYINSLTTTGAVTDITTAVDAGFNGTGNTTFSSTGLQLAMTSTFNLNVQAQGTCNIALFSVWIDFDHSGTFDASELLVNNVAAGNVATSFPITVPVTALSGLTRMRVIDWTNGAAPGVCANLSGWYGETEDYILNIVPLPATPATPVEVGVPNCASGGTLMSGGTAPAGETWYWQTTATGTSTAQPVSTNLTILANGTYYVRAQDNTYLTWSASSSSITVTDFPAGPADPTVSTPGGNPACGSVSLVSSAATAGSTNYWQGTNAVGTSTSSVADDGTNNFPFAANANGTYYVRAQDNTSFCWSNPIATTVTINPLPTAPILSATPSLICTGSSSNLSAIAPSAPPTGYSVSSIPYAPVSPIATSLANAGPTGDEGTTLANIGFSFNFYGTPYSQVYVHTNGYIMFIPYVGFPYTPPAIPNTAMSNAWVGYWSDLNAGAGQITYATLGTAPNRMFVANYNQDPYYSATPYYSGQIVLYEATGAIDVFLEHTQTTNTSACGMENQTGTLGTAAPGRNSGIWAATNEAWHFAPIQAMGFLWTPNGVGSGIPAGNETLANTSTTPSATTTYTMTLTEPVNGCQNTGTVTVNVAPIAPAPSATGATTPCGAASVTLTATGTGGTLRWYDAPAGGNLVNVGSSFATPVIAANATYYVEEYNGACSGPRTAVTATYTPSDAVSATSNVSTVCNGGTSNNTAILTASSVNLNYTYTWQPGGMTGSSVSVTPSATTIYTVTGVDGLCANVSTVTINVNLAPTAPVLSATPSTICPGSATSLSAVAPSAPATNYSVSTIAYNHLTPVSPTTVFAGGSGWDDSYSSPIAIPFPFSFYGNSYSTVSIATNGYVQFSGVNTTNYGQIIPNAADPNNRIAGVHNDLVSGTAGAISYFTTGTAPNRVFVVEFASCGLFGSTGIYSFQIDMYETTGYVEVHVAEANGSASDGAAKTIGVENATGTLAAFPAGRNGANGSWDILSSSPEAYRFSPIQPIGFLWTPNGVGSGINAGDETLANISAMPSATTTYTMTLTDPVNGCQNQGTQLVTVAPVPGAPAVTGAATPCGSASVTLTATGSGGILRWYDAPVGGNLVNVGGSYATPVINATTTYYVEEYNGACSGARSSVVATYTPSTVVIASSNVPSVCAGGPAILTASSANLSYTYTWQPGALSGASVTVNPIVTTTYTVTGVDGACVNIATVTVLAGANPNILSVTATPGTICAGQTSQLFAAVLGGAGSTAPTYCAVTNAGSACITSVIFNTLSSAPPACVSPYYHFNAPTGSNTTTIAPGSTYTFSLVTDPTSIASVWIDYNRDGVYDASEWAQVWTAASSGSIVITVPLGATPGATGMRVRSRLNGNFNGAGDACLNMGSGSTEDYVINIACGGGFNYSWTGSGLSNSTIYNPTATPGATDTYVVTVSDAVTGCTSTGSVVLNVTPVAPAPTAINGATACGVGTVNLGATGTGGTLNWYTAAVGGTLVNTGATYTTPAIAATTTYYVDETNGACTGPRGAVVATFTPSDAVTATSDVTFVCVGGPNSTAVLTASSVNPNYAYTWQPGGMTGASITVTPSATTVYTVTGVDGPCTNIATVVVTGGIVPVINSTTASPASLCGSGISQLLVDAGQLSPSYCTPTVGFAGASGDYIESFTFNTISNLISGDNPSDYALYPQTTTVIPGNTYPLTATPGAAWGQGVGVWIDYNRNGSFADAGEFVFSSVSGTATVSANITIPSGATPGQSRIRVCSHYAATPLSTEYCGHTGFGEYEDYLITIGGGSGALTFSWTPATGLSNTAIANPVATVSATSTYNVSVSDAYGCAATSSVTVTVNQPTASTASVTNCGPYVWNGNTYTVDGTYTYTSVNAAGCDSVQTLILTLACNSVLNLTCFIEGYWDGTSGMVPVLANQGEISAPTACDSIDVELHDAASPYGMIQSVHTLLNQDGTASCIFPPVNGSYYIVVKNRSMVQAWSAAPVAISSTPASYNFTTAEAQAYGAGGFPTAMKEVAPGVWAFYTGDIVVDENVDLLDLGLLETDISDFAFGYQYMPTNINYPGVIATDLNGDGNVDLLDSPIMEDNISNFIFSYHP